MPPKSTCPRNRQERYIRIVSILTFAAFVATGQGCRESGGTRGVEDLKPERAAKPEGILTVVRKLDLGTLPLNGRMELLVAVKNQTNRSITVSGYEVDRPGLRMEPGSFSIEPGESVPVMIDVTTDATRSPGVHKWDITTQTSTDELAFRTTLMLIVRDDIVVRKSDATDSREP